MSKRSVWFGTIDNMRWVPAPLAGAISNTVRWRAVDQLLNGGAVVRQSAASHQTKSLSWPVQSAESLAPVEATLNEPGPYYFLDPIAAQSNAVPSYWAQTAISASGGPALVSGIETKVVSITAQNGYASSAAQLTTTARDTNLVIPVPEGYTLHLGVHGVGGTYRLNNGTAKAPLATNSNVRTNLTVSGPTLARLQLASASSTTYTIAGIVAQVLPNGKTPTPGGFLPGLGSSALQLADDPSITTYSAALPRAQRGIAANFVEVGAWLV